MLLDVPPDHAINGIVVRRGLVPLQLSFLQ
jgi:hypothetical protein